jgi:hypothetical protein
MLRFAVLSVDATESSYTLTTLDDVKAELNITDGSTDALLTRWIAVASHAIHTYTRRTFWQQTVTETFYAPGPPAAFSLTGSMAAGYPFSQRFDLLDCLKLGQYPVSNIASVTVGQCLTPLDPSLYVLTPQDGLLRRLCNDGSGAPVVWEPQNIAVVYTAGYAEADLPADIEQAAITLVKHRWYARFRDPYLRSINVPGVQEESYWVGQIGENGALPPEVVDVLDLYRETRVDAA